MNYLSLLKNASLFGLLTLIIGLFVMFILIRTPLKQECPNKCDRKIWDKYFIREISLFLTGFFSYIIMDVLRQQKIYVLEDTQ
jgi:hypothetical protein